MKLILLLVALVSISSSEPLFIKMQREGHLNEADLPNRKLQNEMVVGPAIDAVFGSCVDTVFNKAQADFNTAVGADESLTWRNANSIQRRVNALLYSGNSTFSGLEAVCKARQTFSQTLGFTYPECINRFYLLNKGDTTINNCMIYVHMYKHLEFICSMAYEVYEDPQRRGCIQAAQASNDYQACLVTFQNALTADPNSLCPSADTMTKCVQNVATTKCKDTAIGWEMCEMERVGYGYDCPKLQCKVPGQV